MSTMFVDTSMASTYVSSVHEQVHGIGRHTHGAHILQATWWNFHYLIFSYQEEPYYIGIFPVY